MPIRAHLAAALALAACSGAAAQRSASPPPMTLAQSGIVPEWMDVTADPCADFFQFACGGVLAAAQIPPHRATWGVVPIVIPGNEPLLRPGPQGAARRPGGKLGEVSAARLYEDAAATPP